MSAASMPGSRLRTIAAGALLGLLAIVAGAGGAAELHGTSDAFSGNGVAVAWGILRGASEDATTVVLRVAAEPGRYARIAANGVDPFSKETKPIAAPRALAGLTDLRIARRHFADFPRTELAFFDQSAATPALVVYYLGVPDTTPEFANDGALEAYLNDRIARLRGGGTTK